MKVLLSFTWASLKKNRARTAVTILGIILSMTLFTAVLVGAASGRTWLADNEIAKCGAWEGNYYSLDSSLLERAMSQDFIKDASVWTDVGWALLPNENPSKPYLFIQSIDEKAEELVSIHLKSGRLPQNSGEILLPAHLETSGGLRFAEGDTLKLETGRRQAEGRVMTEKAGFFPSDGIAETIVDTAEKTYTVVGFYERFDYSIEGYACPGYTALTTGETEGIGLSTLFFTMEHPSRFYTEVEKDDLLSRNLEPHSNLLLYSGQVRDSGVLRVLYGMVAILLVLIVFGSVALIYNSFSISIAERLKSYGVLRSVGATKRQVRMTVLMESLILCGIGIPLGMGLGLAGIGGVLAFLRKDFSAVFGASYSYVPIRIVFSLPSLLMAVAICLVTTLISALIPAQKAIHASAMDAIRQTGEIRGNKAKGGSISGKIFGFGGTLAGRNYARSRRKYVITILSLALSLVLFISSASFSDYLRTYLNAYAADYIGADLYVYNTDEEADPRDLLEGIRAAKHVEEGAVSRSCYADLYVPAENVTGEYRDFTETWRGGDEVVGGMMRFYGTAQFLDDDTFKAWCGQLGLDPAAFMNAEDPQGIVVNHAIHRVYDGEKRSQMRYSLDILEDGAKTLTWYTAEQMEGYQFKSVEVAEDGVHLWYLPESALETVVDEKGEYIQEDDEFLEDHPEKLITLELKAGAMAGEHPWMDAAGSDSLAIIYPLSMMEHVIPENDVQRANHYTQYAVRAAEHTAAAEEVESFLDESGSAGQVYDQAQQKETYRMFLKILTVFSTCFIVLMALISAVNVFNTISTNIRLRRREFAILKSVGMGEKDFTRMMRCESLLYVTRSLVLGLALAFLFTYAIFKVIGQNLVGAFYVPWHAIVIAVILVIAIVFFTASRAVGQLKGKDLAEELKLENT